MAVIRRFPSRITSHARSTGLFEVRKLNGKARFATIWPDRVIHLTHLDVGFRLSLHARQMIDVAPIRLELKEIVGWPLVVLSVTWAYSLLPKAASY